MSDEKRARRLLGLVERKVRAAAARVAEASHRVHEAQGQVEARQQAWRRAADDFGRGVGCVGDLAAQSAYLGTLGNLTEAARRHHRETLDAERKAIEAQRAVKTEQRKFELWAARMGERAAEQAARAERQQTDEAAARTTREAT